MQFKSKLVLVIAILIATILPITFNQCGDATQINDEMSNSSNGTPNNQAPFQFSSAKNQVVVGEFSQLFLTGGKAPYTVTVNPMSAGSVDTNFIFGAAQAGSVTLIATDANGTQKQATLVIDPPAQQYVPMTFSSSLAQMTVGQMAQLTVTDGTPSYTFTVTPATRGTVNANTLKFSAVEAGSAVIRVTDSTLAFKEVTINITAAAQQTLGTPVQFMVATAGSNYIVPTGVTKLRVAAWGAGGGGGGHHNQDAPYGTGGAGGGGGYVECDLNVVSGETLSVRVGGGGHAGTGGQNSAPGGDGGGGGGYSGLMRATTPLVIAGAGGGGGGGGSLAQDGVPGGAGGGVSGVSPAGTSSGDGGMAASGGLGGAGGNEAGVAGAARLGGNAGAANLLAIGGVNGGGKGGLTPNNINAGSGGGGGAGYFGGGGAGSNTGASAGGGGGGGSSLCSGTTISNVAGSGINPGNITHASYIANRGKGGLGSANKDGKPGLVGEPGLVVIRPYQ